MTAPTDGFRRARQRARLRRMSRGTPELVYPGDPFRPLVIDAGRISLSMGTASDLPDFVGRTRRGALSGWYAAGFIIGGQWHESARPYVPEDSPLFRALEGRYHDRIAWEDTDWLADVARRLADGETVWNGCRTRADLRRRLRKMNWLIESVRETGFQASRDPVVISIGPNGEYIKSGNGRHRIMLARISGRPLPVRIAVRHADWVAREATR